MFVEVNARILANTSSLEKEIPKFNAVAIAAVFMFMINVKLYMYRAAHDLGAQSQH